MQVKCPHKIQDLFKKVSHIQFELFVVGGYVEKFRYGDELISFSL